MGEKNENRKLFSSRQKTNIIQNPYWNKILIRREYKI